MPLIHHFDKRLPFPKNPFLARGCDYFDGALQHMGGQRDRVAMQGYPRAVRYGNLRDSDFRSLFRVLERASVPAEGVSLEYFYCHFFDGQRSLCGDTQPKNEQEPKSHGLCPYVLVS